MGQFKTLGKNTILIFIGNVGSKFIGFLMLPLYTRWLSVEDYGVSDIITVYTTLLMGLASCCISESIFIFPKNCTKEIQKKYFTTGSIFLLGMIAITAVFFFVLRYSLVGLGYESSFTSYTWWIYLMLVAQTSQTFIQQFCRALDKIAVFSFVGIILAVLTTIFSFLLIPKYGVQGYVLSIAISSLVTTTITFLSIKAPRYIDIKSISYAHLKEMLTYSIPLIPNAIMWWAINSLNRPLLEAYMGLTGIGLLAVAQKIPNIIQTVLGVFSSSWQISVIDEYGKGSFSQFYNHMSVLLCFAMTFLLLIISTFAEPIMTLIVGPEFVQAHVFVPLMCTTVFFLTLNTVVSPIFSAVRKGKYFFYTSIYGAISSVLLNFILIPLFGIWGATISICASQGIMAIARIYYSETYIKLENKFLYILLFIILALVVSGDALMHQLRYIFFVIACVVIIGLLNLKKYRFLCKISRIMSLKDS